MESKKDFFVKEAIEELQRNNIYDKQNIIENYFDSVNIDKED